MFKNASWFLALSLGALLLFTASQIPSPGDSPLTLHLATRYIQKSFVETGVHSSTAAVAADYRAFDLFTAGFLLALSALSLFLYSAGPSRIAVILPVLLWLGGSCLTLGLGFFSLAHRSNFLDYEALASGGEAALARLNGALLLEAGVFLSLAGFVLMVVQWAKTPEASHERS